jgi:hypothetical protein
LGFFPLLFFAPKNDEYCLLLLGPSGASTTKVIYVKVIYIYIFSPGQTYAYGLYCCRVHGCNQSSVIRLQSLGGASYMVLIL